MKDSVMTKIVIIAALCFLFVIGLGMISMLISERKYYHKSVMDDIKETHVREQYVITPFLLLQNQNNNQVLFADSSNIDMLTSVSQDEYHRGIYHAISYNGQFTMTQNFNLKVLIRLLSFYQIHHKLSKKLVIKILLMEHKPLLKVMNICLKLNPTPKLKKIKTLSKNYPW